MNTLLLSICRLFYDDALHDSPIIHCNTKQIYAVIEMLYIDSCGSSHHSLSENLLSRNVEYFDVFKRFAIRAYGDKI